MVVMVVMMVVVMMMVMVVAVVVMMVMFHRRGFAHGRSRSRLGQRGERRQGQRGCQEGRGQNFLQHFSSFQSFRPVREGRLWSEVRIVLEFMAPAWKPACP